MLHNLDEIRHTVIEAEDGEIGRCNDFLFDDRLWTIRYMVADTRKWLPGRKVLVSPISLASPDWQGKRFPVKLTRDQIKESPPLEDDQPVSREYESRYFDYYHWPHYWVGPYYWGLYKEPQGVYTKQDLQPVPKEELQINDSHLRSMKEVLGYHIQATDGEIGHVEEFIADDQTWTIRYLVVDTRNWLPGRKVLVASDWINDVSWSDRKVYVALTREKIKESPPYNPDRPLDREYEGILYDYFGKLPYW